MNEFAAVTPSWQLFLFLFLIPLANGFAGGWLYTWLTRCLRRRRHKHSRPLPLNLQGR
jgi:hypothetical protein